MAAAAAAIGLSGERDSGPSGVAQSVMSFEVDGTGVRIAMAVPVLVGESHEDAALVLQMSQLLLSGVITNLITDEPSIGKMYEPTESMRLAAIDFVRGRQPWNDDAIYGPYCTPNAANLLLRKACQPIELGASEVADSKGAQAPPPVGADASEVADSKAGAPSAVGAVTFTDASAGANAIGAGDPEGRCIMRRYLLRNAFINFVMEKQSMTVPAPRAVGQFILALHRAGVGFSERAHPYSLTTPFHIAVFKSPAIALALVACNDAQFSTPDRNATEGDIGLVSASGGSGAGCGAAYGGLLDYGAVSGEDGGTALTRAVRECRNMDLCVALIDRMTGPGALNVLANPCQTMYCPSWCPDRHTVLHECIDEVGSFLSNVTGNGTRERVRCALSVIQALLARATDDAAAPGATHSVGTDLTLRSEPHRRIGAHHFSETPLRLFQVNALFALYCSPDSATLTWTLPVWPGVKIWSDDNFVRLASRTLNDYYAPMQDIALDGSRLPVAFTVDDLLPVLAGIVAQMRRLEDRQRTYVREIRSILHNALATALPVTDVRHLLCAYVLLKPSH